MAMKTYKLSGDWMRDGYIDNLNRPSRLDVLVVDGKAYDPELYGLPDDAGRMDIDADDCIRAWGASTSFCPGDGDIERIGRHVFRSAE